MERKKSTSQLSEKNCEVRKLTLTLLKEGRITINESRILLGLEPIVDSQSEKSFKTV
ncbi:MULTISPECIES: hypothetical protein [Bacillus cereus group]|uniref:Fur-regulated basic protein FbpA n=1 Tax=Bacillus cereus TaxID=1396 RepID=A0ABD7DKD0_BACCE|nr:MULTISPECIES: hypothetical protein [Bacillus cereus group]QRY16952.1 hypothetical protein JTF64_06775 [Bacillus cereus]HDR8244621.1 hypothetical protein [Bacillus cereus]